MAMINKARLMRHLEDMGIRADAGETALILRSLLFVEQEIYKVEYVENRAAEFIPLDTTVPAWADSFSWRLLDWRGMAKLIRDAGTDLPAVDIILAEFIQKVYEIGDSFNYTLNDLRAAAKNNMPLDTEKGELARAAQENLIEVLAAFGDASTGMPGFLNNPNVPILTSPGQLNGNWLNPATTPAQILADMHYMAQSVVNVTKNVQKPDTMLLPTAHFGYIAQTQANPLNLATILEVFLKQSQYIRSVDQWPYLDNANATGNGPRGMVYKRDPKAVRLVRPLPFEMLPPQPKGLAFVIPCHSRFGGVSWRRPMSGAYADGI